MLTKQSILEAVNPLYVLNAQLTEYFQLQMRLNPECHDYIVSRGFEEYILDFFKIGYCPSGQAVYDFVIGRGWDSKLLEEIGFWTDKPDTVYVKFENRLMFPFTDLSGIIHGFSGRILTDDKTQQKYINTSNCAVYNKSLVVYGFNEALRCNPTIDQWVIVEGNADVVSMFQANFTTTVACAGVAITEQQLLRLSQYTKRFVVMLDNDTAGLQGMAKLPKMCKDLHLDLKIATLREVKDADEAIRTGRTDLITEALQL